MCNSPVQSVVIECFYICDRIWEKVPLCANYQFPVWAQIVAHLVLYSIQTSNFKRVYLTNRSSYKLQTKCNWKLTDCSFLLCENPKIKVLLQVGPFLKSYHILFLSDHAGFLQHLYFDVTYVKICVFIHAVMSCETWPNLMSNCTIPVFNARRPSDSAGFWFNITWNHIISFKYVLHKPITD